MITKQDLQHFIFNRFVKGNHITDAMTMFEKLWQFIEPSIIKREQVKIELQDIASNYVDCTEIFVKDPNVEIVITLKQKI